jgi:hypothetical protein
MRDRADVVYIDTVRADAGNQHLPDIGSTPLPRRYFFRRWSRLR